MLTSRKNKLDVATGKKILRIKLAFCYKSNAYQYTKNEKWTNIINIPNIFPALQLKLVKKKIKYFKYFFKLVITDFS